MKTKQLPTGWKEVELKNKQGNLINLKIRTIKNPKKKFIAKASNFGVFGLGYISVDSLFSDFSENEQEAMLFHEYWHYKNNLKFEIKVLFSKKFWIFFFQNKLNKLQEFEADKYAVSEKGKENVISFLKEIKELEKAGKIEYNYKNHPSIKERIQKIKNEN